MTRVIVTGDRNWPAVNIAVVVLSRLIRKHGAHRVTIVHGDASGVDAAFDEMAEALHVRREPHPADWDGLGKKAGPVRNSAMVAAGADFAIAVHRQLGFSKGTRDCAAKCLAAGIPVYWVASNDVVPVRIYGFDGTAVLTKEPTCARSAAS